MNCGEEVAVGSEHVGRRDVGVCASASVRDTVGHGSLFAFGRKGICGLRISARTTTLSAVGHAVEEEAGVGTPAA